MRQPTQHTEGPWPFLFSVDPQRGVVQNVGVRESRPRVRITTDAPRERVLIKPEVAWPFATKPAPAPKTRHPYPSDAEEAPF